MKYILTLGLLCCTWLLCHHANAQQNYTTYQFLSEKDGRALTVVNTTLKGEAERIQENELVQFFILKRTTDGKTLILSAANNSLFLKRSGNSVVLSTVNGTPGSDYEWTIRYAGYPYCLITNPGNAGSALKMGTSSLTMATMPALSGNNDAKANTMRFRLQTVTKTF